MERRLYREHSLMGSNEKARRLMKAFQIIFFVIHINAVSLSGFW